MFPSSDRAVTESKITGTFRVGILRAPKRRTVRSAARRPTADGLSSLEWLRAEEYQKSRSMASPCRATGVVLNEQLLVR